MKLVSFILISCSVPLLSGAAEKFVVIGDSLSKEYELEFPLLNPANPAAWGERNWLELLAEERSDFVDIGKEALWPDSRLIGHEYNFAFPGSTSSEWEEILTSNVLTKPEFVLSRFNLNLTLEEQADRVVIFLGGNDLKNSYDIYSDGVDPTDYINMLVSNMETIVDHVRDINDEVPIVLANFPDVGATPLVIDSYPDPGKRQLVTDITRQINIRLQQLAEEKGIGYADIEQFTRRLIESEHIVTGGVRFFSSADPDRFSNDPIYLFSPDEFHPNTAVQLLLANEILTAFQEAYPLETVIPIFDSEEMLMILEIDSDVSTEQWAEAFGLTAFIADDDMDADGVPLLEEFVFGMDPRVGDSEKRPQSGWTEGQLELRFHQRLAMSDQFIVIPEFSDDLLQWIPVPTDQTEQEPGLNRAWVFPDGARKFLRLNITSL